MRWKAIYSDGTYLLGGDGLAKYTDIDTDKLVRFELIKDGRCWIGTDLGEGKRLIYRERVMNHFNIDVIERVQLVGWQQNVGGRNVQSILFVFEDGRIEHLDRFREDDVLFDKVNFLPQEQTD